MRWHPILLSALTGALDVACSPVLPSPALATAASTTAPSLEPAHDTPSAAQRAESAAEPSVNASPASAESLPRAVDTSQAAHSTPAHQRSPALAAPPAVLIEVETPYKPNERPRPEGVILAAGEDEKLARWNVGGTGDPDFISNRASYHPGARVVVNTKLIAGSLPQRSSQGLSQRDLLAQSRSKGYWPLRICYEDALRRDPEQSGESRLRLSIAASGRVTRVRLKDSELDPEAGECLREALTDLRFRPGPRSGMIAVDLSVEFWPGDAPLPGLGRAADDDSSAPLDAPGISHAVNARLGDVRTCYRAGLERDPELWGRLQLLIEVAAEGETMSVTQTESRFPDAQVSECIISAFKGVRFPAQDEEPLKFIQAFRLGVAKGIAPKH